MFERRILVMALVRNRQRTMQGLFKALGKSRHSRPLWPPTIMIAVARSGNNNLYHYIVTPDRGERPAPATRLNSERLHPGKTGGTPGKEGARPSDPSYSGCKTRSCLPGFAQGYFFSITHCRGCWCLRAKSITWVTLVSAIS